MEVATPYAAESRGRCATEASDRSWMRMRTPSPERTYSVFKGGQSPSSLEPVALLESSSLQCWRSDVRHGNAWEYPEFKYNAWAPSRYVAYEPVMCIPLPQEVNCQVGYSHMPEADVETTADSDRESRRSASVDGQSDSYYSAPWLSRSPPSSGSDDDQQEIASSDMQDMCKPCDQEEDDDLDTSAPSALNSVDIYSKGTIGHPHSCGEGCKYFPKPRGCKDGANCDHCHICSFKTKKPKPSRRHAR